ncbi:MAG TPA: DUF5343 domain-containing protein [Holophagaceae bacterium]|jgi:hypothetical protein|nr:DUF5343 domain-containing protein [Holophagaceae bacterium]
MAKKEEAEAHPKSQTDELGEKKSKTTLKYPPYVFGYGSIAKLFTEITKASVPPKFTQDFMETVLELKSSSHRALIPLLKKLGFIDAANAPTEAYKNYRDSEQSRGVMAARVRSAYSDLYKANEYAHNLKKEELQSKLRALIGASEDDPQIPVIVGTFMELVKLADFKAAALSSKPQSQPEKLPEGGATRKEAGATSIGLSYTINLNLPATTEIEVFNAIFKSLKEHLLDG